MLHFDCEFLASTVTIPRRRICAHCEHISQLQRVTQISSNLRNLDGQIEVSLDIWDKYMRKLDDAGKRGSTLADLNVFRGSN